MERRKFIEYLEKHPALYSVEEKTREGAAGVVVKDSVYKTTTFFSDSVIGERDLMFLLKRTHHGKNVEQITRVTGYFSKVNSWNKGKKAELKDRYRSNLEGVREETLSTAK